MMKNVKLKKLLKKTVYKPLTIINRLLPKKDKTVLLYISSMGIRHNLKPLLEYLISHGYNKEYKIYCGIESLKYSGPEYYNVKYIGKIKSHMIFLTAKHVFYTAGQLPIKPGKDQCVIHLTHGAVYYKAMGAISNIDNGDEFFFSKMIVTGNRFREIVKKAYRCKDENLLLCNEPMTDAFYNHQNYVPMDNIQGKLIFWLPTFRQSDTTGYNNSNNTETLLVFKESDYDELNEYLCEKNITIIVKLHAAQSLKNVHNSSYSNLLILSHEDFQSRGLDIYELMCRSDALIGDYSSASLQYLLLNKPMAYVIPDLEDYKLHRGFVFENPLEYMPGNIITNKSEFYRFIEDMANEIDRFSSERKTVCNEIHYYQDGNACERVINASGMKLKRK